MAIRTHIGAGARRYKALVGLPEARWPLVFSIAGSMPIGMYGLAILLLVRDANGSFAVAGRVVGAFGLANALGAVVQGRPMDRLGQRRGGRPPPPPPPPALPAPPPAPPRGR